MSKSTRPFHPLDVENNRRYKVTKNSTIPSIDDMRSNTHDELLKWEGYIRIPEKSVHSFSLDVFGGGYIEIDGKKIVEIEESFLGETKRGEKELDKGFHHVTLFYNCFSSSCEDITEYHLEVFKPRMDNKRFELWDIDEPKNLWKIEDANRLLECYKPVNYESKGSDQVYDYIGGWLKKSHDKEIQDNVPYEDRIYKYSCALRLSIALSAYGIDLKGAEGAVPVGKDANLNVLGGGTHVILGAANMCKCLRNLLDEADYKNPDEPDGYITPQDTDIVIFGEPGGVGVQAHVGMCPGTNPDVGGGMAGSVWLLHRDTLDD